MTDAAGEVYARMRGTLCENFCCVIDDDKAFLLFRLILRHPAGSHGNPCCLHTMQ
jgi:hypothetical protein